jgi:hypothetical protein
MLTFKTHSNTLVCFNFFNKNQEEEEMVLNNGELALEMFMQKKETIGMQLSTGKKINKISLVLKLNYLRQ